MAFVLKRRIAAILVSIAICLIASCNKTDNIPPVNVSPNKSNGTLEVECIHDNLYEDYELLDSSSNSWEWTYYKNNQFQFCKEIEWDVFEHDINQLTIAGERSFDVEYDDGATVHVFDVNSTQNSTSFKVIDEYGDTVPVNVTFNTDVDFMAQIGLLENNSGNVSMNCIPWPIIYKGVKYVVFMVGTIYAVHCIDAMANAAKECEEHAVCKATKHTCSVTCRVKENVETEYDCSQHDYNG